MAALRGEGNPLALPPATAVVVVVVDGLGSAALKQRAAYARTLNSAGGSLWSGFPTTTAAALTTITTGTLPGSHGLVGYSVLDPDNDRVVKQLSGWDAGLLDPLTWQREPTLFEGLAGSGIAAYSVGPGRYATSGLTKAILRGATYRSAESIEARFETATSILRSSERSLVYVYVPELDMAGHKYGWESDAWSRALEQVDSEVARLAGALRSDQAMLVTADHGVVDVQPQKHVLFGGKPELLAGVRHIGGEPRCLQLYFEPDLETDPREHLVEAWRAAEGHRSWVVTRAEAIEAGWFGPVAPEVEPRIGDLLVAARKGIAYYRDADQRGRSMVGQHGSWSPEETQVPLAMFGAFRA
ncbi:alkaline phosphatase family protein [Frondihabitans sucicola]|uniref:Alkaline phosphatase family protein n=1 Tax=Frondihabitans sucicola TaxID=1268041 RepID=A0ABM8GQU1_9MICO|nr:alkaline phosphatase family protein [Frondihabitans sucicola]